MRLGAAELHRWIEYKSTNSRADAVVLRELIGTTSPIDADERMPPPFRGMHDLDKTMNRYQWLNGCL